MTRPEDPTPEPVLDADIAQALDSALAPLGTDEAAVQRVRSRLMLRIAAESTPRHHTVMAGEPLWRPFLPGIECKVLHRDGATLSYLLRLAAGAILPAHRHPADEECVVLEGILRIGDQLELPPGSFHLGRKDVPHADISTETGAVIYLRGAHPAPELLI